MLTGLPNRRYFFNELVSFQEQVEKEELEDFAVFVIDLNDFKSINDSYGHEKGDHLLVEVARRLQEVVSDDAVVARLGGDELFSVRVSVGADVYSRTKNISDMLRKADLLMFSDKTFKK